MSSAPDDKLTATLAGWREIEQAASAGPWQAVRGVWEEEETFPAVISRDGDPCRAETWLMAAGRGSPDPESNAQFAAASRTAMPLLFAAIEAAMNLADKWDASGDVGRQFAARGLREAITAALTGKAGSGA